MEAMPKVRRSTGVALTMALMLSIGVQCLVGQKMTTAQMACCAAADHDCQAAISTEDCCRTESSEQEQLVYQVQQLVPPVALATSTILALLRPSDTYAASAAAIGADTAKLKASSPPTYVLLASFLI